MNKHIDFLYYYRIVYYMLPDFFIQKVPIARLMMKWNGNQGVEKKLPESI